jgi:imidazoleglycerol-phosphate dehydratase
MDDALVQTAIDLSGRSSLFWNVPFGSPKIGNFDVELVHEFFNAICNNAGINMHVVKVSGTNSHHVAEAAFKSIARALRTAVQVDPRQRELSADN